MCAETHVSTDFNTSTMLMVPVGLSRDRSTSKWKTCSSVWGARYALTPRSTSVHAHIETIPCVLHKPLFRSFPPADKVCSLPWQREQVITPDCVILCQTRPLYMTIIWLESILYYTKPNPSVVAHIGSLIKSQRSTVHNMHWAWRMYITDHFSWLLFYRHPIREIRAALWLAYQIATL